MNNWGTNYHATEAMGEIGLFSLVQVYLSILLTFIPTNHRHSNFHFWILQEVVMMKGFMDWCTSHETVITHLREKVEARDAELRKLMVWKEVQVNKLDLTKQLLKESEALVEALKKILMDKEVKISEAKHHLR